MVISSVKIDDLEVEISKAIREYTEDVSTAIEEEIDTTAKNMCKEIKINSPKKFGKYSKGFRVNKENKKGEVVRIIYNKDKPGLIHLLELGHAKKNGGRVSAIPHMRPAYDKLEPTMEKNIQNIIKKGGK